MRGAHAIAVGDRGKSLDVGAENPREHFGFGIAQFGKLVRHMRHRAVVLADLVAVSDALDRGRVTISREGVCDGRQGVGCITGGHGALLLEVSQSRPGKVGNRFRALRVAQKPHGLTGEVVVPVTEVVATRVGDRKDARWAAAPATTQRPTVA